MKYKCIIVDDEELARGLIKNHLARLNDFELVASCESAIEANKILKNESIDLLFLDIEMPVLTGTEFLKSLMKKPKVIFTTAHRDFAIEGFELNAVDYLLKPISFARFFKAIEKFLEQNHKRPTLTDNKEPSKNSSIFIRKDRKQVKILFSDILYIESVKDYIKIVTEEGKHLTKQGLTSFLEQLDHRFLRTHRSYIVNTDKITAYTKNDVEIVSLEIPIGETYKLTVQERLVKY